MTNIFIASDHAGFDLKQAIIAQMAEFSFVDCGTYNGVKSCDYPVFARRGVHKYLAFKKKDSQGDGFLILVCGSGVGVSIVANRNRFIRAALCHDVQTAMLAREHNHANCLCLAARTTSTAQAIEIIKAFNSAKPQAGRHARRVKKINPLIYQRSIFVRIKSFFGF